MQAFCCEVVRAFTKLGIAIAAKSPIMATTIMISTRVKPALRDALIFILLFVTFCFFRGERNNRRVTIIALFVHGLPVAPVAWEVAEAMPELSLTGKFVVQSKGPKHELRASRNLMPVYGSLCVGMLQVGGLVTQEPGE